MGISRIAVDQFRDKATCYNLEIHDVFDLPRVGARLREQETICTPVGDQCKGVIEVSAPADCEVLAVNDAVDVNSSPEDDDGWIVKLRLLGNLPGLMDAAAYMKHVDSKRLKTGRRVCVTEDMSIRG